MKCIDGAFRPIATPCKSHAIFFYKSKGRESLKYNGRKGGSLSDSQISIVTFKLYLMVCLRSIFAALHIVKPLKIIYFPLDNLYFIFIFTRSSHQLKIIQYNNNPYIYTKCYKI